MFSHAAFQFRASLQQYAARFYGNLTGPNSFRGLHMADASEDNPALVLVERAIPDLALACGESGRVARGSKKGC
jgi:hypothetical protein